MLRALFISVRDAFNAWAGWLGLVFAVLGLWLGSSYGLFLSLAALSFFVRSVMLQWKVHELERARLRPSMLLGTAVQIIESHQYGELDRSVALNRIVEHAASGEITVFGARGWENAKGPIEYLPAIPIPSDYWRDHLIRWPADLAGSLAFTCDFRSGEPDPEGYADLRLDWHQASTVLENPFLGKWWSIWNWWPHSGR